jgi:hypothetical protein
MIEVGVRGEELNGIARTIKSLMDGNLKDPAVCRSIGKVKGSLVVTEPATGVSATIFFDKGTVQIQNGTIARPSAYLKAGFEELAEVSSGQVGPVKALLTGKVKAGGNLIKLLQMSKAVICKEG